MNDDEMMKQVSGAEFRRKVGLVLVLAGLVAVVAGATLFIPPAETSSVGWIVCGAIAAACLIAGLTLRITARIPPEAKTGRLALLRAERLQRGRQAAFLLMPLSLIMMLNGVLRATSRLLSGTPMRHVDSFIVICFVAFLLAFAYLIAGGGLDRWARPVLDDELSRELRSKALRFGYAILVPGVVCLFLIGLFRRDLATELAPVLAALGVGGPAVRLFWLERAAGVGAAEA